MADEIEPTSDEVDFLRLDTPIYDETPMIPVYRRIRCPHCTGLIDAKDFDKEMTPFSIPGHRPTSVCYKCPACGLTVSVPADKVPGIVYKNI